jgi:hypothetical protein
MPPHSTHSLTNVICCADRISRSSVPVHSALGPRHPTPHDTCCPLHSPQLNADNVTKPNDSHMIITGHYVFWRGCPHPSGLVLGVKNKIQTIDLPHELRAKFNSLFELLLRFAF